MMITTLEPSIESLTLKAGLDSPPSSQVFWLGGQPHTFGGEDRDGGVVADVGEGDDAEEEGEFLEGDDSVKLGLGFDLGEQFKKGLVGVELEDVGPVDVFPTPAVIEQSNYIIEY